MSRPMMLAVTLLAFLSAHVYADDSTAALRIRFGFKDKQPTDWSGAITPASGKVEWFVDSTTGKLATKDDTGTVTDYAEGAGIPAGGTTAQVLLGALAAVRVEGTLTLFPSICLSGGA